MISRTKVNIGRKKTCFKGASLKLSVQRTSFLIPRPHSAWTNISVLWRSPSIVSFCAMLRFFIHSDKTICLIERQAIAAEGSKKSGFPAQQHQSSTDFSQHPTNVASLHHQSGSVEQQQQMAGLSQHQYHQPGFNTQCPGAPPMQQSGFYGLLFSSVCSYFHVFRSASFHFLGLGNQRERNVNNPLEKYNFRFNNKQGAGPPDTGDGNKTTMQKDSYDQTGKYAGKTLPSGTSSTPVAPKRAWSNKGRMTANFHKTVGTPNKGKLPQHNFEKFKILSISSHLDQVEGGAQGPQGPSRSSACKTRHRISKCRTWSF